MGWDRAGERECLHSNACHGSICLVDCRIGHASNHPTGIWGQIMVSGGSWLVVVRGDTSQICAGENKCYLTQSRLVHIPHFALTPLSAGSSQFHTLQPLSAQQLFSHSVAEAAPVSSCRPLHRFPGTAVKTPFGHVGPGGVGGIWSILT